MLQHTKRYVHNINVILQDALFCHVRHRSLHFIPTELEMAEE